MESTSQAMRDNCNAHHTLPTDAFVLPELTLIPFQPGQHMVSIARMDRPPRDIGGTTFPNVLISVLPGPGQATIMNGQSSWLSSLDESVVVDVNIPGAILVFITIRPTDFETTGLHIQIKKIEAKQEVAQPFQTSGHFQEQPAHVVLRQGVPSFGQAMVSSPQDADSPSSPFTAVSAPPMSSPRTEPPFVSQAFERRFTDHSSVTSQQSEVPGQPSQMKAPYFPQFAPKPFGQQESSFAAPMQKQHQSSSPLPQAKPFSSVFGVGNAQPASDGQKDNMLAYSASPQQEVASTGFSPIQQQEGPQNTRLFAPLFQVEPPRPETKPVWVHACGHIQNQGDVACNPEQSIGTPSSQLRLEAVAFKPEGIDPAQFEYATVSHDGCLSPWTTFPHFSGSRGSGMPLLGFIARLTGDTADKYQVVYSGSFLKAGKLSEVRDGQFLHSTIQGDALESLSLSIVPKG